MSRPGGWPIASPPAAAMPDANDAGLSDSGLSAPGQGEAGQGEAGQGEAGSSDGDLIAIARAAVERLTGGPGTAHILAAVSGGPDSLALLDLLASAWPGQVRAATVDHGLRPESAAEAQHVAAICAARGIDHAILTLDAPIAGNLQSAARAARYARLAAEADRTGCAWIATAHHADDQLETMLMRLGRGAGLDGLAGVRARNGRVIRPLLALRKAALIGWCEARGMRYVRDPSNMDPAFDRARMRRALEAFDLIDPRAAVRSAGALADSAAALAWAAEREAVRALVADGDGIGLDPAGYPAALLRRLVILALQRIEPDAAPRGPALDRLLAQLQSGEQAMLGNVLCRGGPIWRFAAAPPRRSG